MDGQETVFEGKRADALPTSLFLWLKGERFTLGGTGQSGLEVMMKANPELFSVIADQSSSVPIKVSEVAELIKAKQLTLVAALPTYTMTDELCTEIAAVFRENNRVIQDGEGAAESLMKIESLKLHLLQNGKNPLNGQVLECTGEGLTAGYYKGKFEELARQVSAFYCDFSETIGELLGKSIAEDEGSAVDLKLSKILSSTRLSMQNSIESLEQLIGKTQNSSNFQGKHSLFSAISALSSSLEGLPSVSFDYHLGLIDSLTQENAELMSIILKESSYPRPSRRGKAHFTAKSVHLDTAQLDQELAEMTEELQTLQDLCTSTSTMKTKRLCSLDSTPDEADKLRKQLIELEAECVLLKRPLVTSTDHTITMLRNRLRQQNLELKKLSDEKNSLLRANSKLRDRFSRLQRKNLSLVSLKAKFRELNAMYRPLHEATRTVKEPRKELSPCPSSPFQRALQVKTSEYEKLRRTHADFIEVLRDKEELLQELHHSNEQHTRRIQDYEELIKEEDNLIAETEQQLTVALEQQELSKRRISDLELENSQLTERLRT